MHHNSTMIINILWVGGVACLMFTVLIATAGTTGIADAVRDEEGRFRKKLTVTSALGLLLMLSFILGMLLWGNYRWLQLSGASPTLLSLWVNGFGIFMVLHLYDLIVLDYLIIVRWHPKFLNLPNTDYYTSFRPHFIGFLRGLPLGMLLSFVAALLNIYV